MCQKFFQFINAVGEHELKNLKRQLKEEGVGERIHGNVHQANTSLPLDQVEHVVKFIRTYGIQHSLILPERAPGFHEFVYMIILPSTMTKLVVYSKYIAGHQR